MQLIPVIFVLVIIGVVLWFINRYIPMPGAIKTIINVLVVIVVVWWLLSLFGLVSGDMLSNLKLK